MPEIQLAMLAGHDMLFLGEKGRVGCVAGGDLDRFVVLDYLTSPKSIPG